MELADHGHRDLLARRTTSRLVTSVPPCAARPPDQVLGSWVFESRPTVSSCGSGIRGRDSLSEPCWGAN